MPTTGATPPAGTDADLALAADVAAAAGRLLVDLRSGGRSGRDLGAAGDRASDDFILGRLAAARPADAVLSEESADGPERLGAERVWIVDPLDGTREYAMPGRSDWAVHIALWERGRPVEAPFAAAAVAVPATGELFTGAGRGAIGGGPPGGWAGGGPAGGGSAGGGSAGGGAAGTAGGDPVGPVGGGRARPLIVVSDSRPPDFARAVAEAVGAEVAPMGSAGAKAMAVVRGDADAYLHAGGQWEWDSAAPVGVLHAAGFHATRLDGSPLLYNQPRPYLPDLLICRPALAGPLLDALTAVGAI